ncbi:MAG TPA: c-type cytochrome [Frateuria sp.]|uniref:cytochrome c oxidase subunit II n=1 Tax=Frateuria sp. TaxID=2211372 RepID=UPI002D7E50C2|nr:c-type cytochrome [Frateuria sp.]HET6805118.1 c-type cytochrome [Frateuria sp.]
MDRVRHRPLRASGAAALALLLGGCGAPQDFLFPEGPAARRLAELGWTALIAFSAVTVIVWILLVVVIARRRGSFSEHAPIDTAPQGIGWILVGGLIVPVAVLGAMFVFTLHTLGQFPMGSHSSAADIRVEGRQWWFDAVYTDQGPAGQFHVPSELHIPVGKPVTIELVTRDVIHSFWVPKLHGKVDLVPGLDNHIRLQADRPGVYEGECAEFCGAQHAHMRLRVFADTPADYARWRAAQMAGAAPPRTPAARRGYAVFMAAPCAACHTIRGTPAQGQVGPDLTHVGSRTRIAGGSLVNDTANLEAWIVHAQSLKPGARMPDIDKLTGAQLRDLTTYLQSLK